MARFDPPDPPRWHRQQTGRSLLGRLLLVVGGFVTIVASFQPWIIADTEQGTVTLLGTDRNGTLTLLAGVLIVVAAVLPPRLGGRLRRMLVIVAALTIPLDALWDPTNVYQRIASEYVRGAIQPALWLTAVGGLVAIVGAVLVPPPPPETPALPPWPTRPRPDR